MEPIDFNNLNGPQRAALRVAFLNAFTREELRRLLSDRLNKSWDAYTPEGDLEEQIFALIDKSQAEGWTEVLVREAETKRPTNRYFARLSVTLRLMVPAPAPLAPPGESQRNLERMIARSEITAMSEFNSLQGRICRMEAGKSVGTGFLIANDIVLTNYHVIEHVESSDGRGVICRFDFLTTGDAGRKGREVRLATKSAWLVASSRYAASEVGADASPPTAEQLDFALLRLEERAGEDLVNGARRGSIVLSAEAPQPVKDDAVLIIQHADGGPLAMSFGTVIGYDASHVRVRYAASTRAGSSGSPVFASDLSLVALHHAGDPNWNKPAEYNQGIPIGMIASWLEVKGIKFSGQNDRSDLLPDVPTPPKIGSLVVLGEPKPPTPPAAGKAITDLLQSLTTRGAAFTQWAEGWRDERPLSDADTTTLLGQRPAFIRTIVDHAKIFPDEFNDLTYKLHRRFGRELDDEHPVVTQLRHCPRILWRPGGPAWSGHPPTPPGYGNTDAPEGFASWLADLMGLQEAAADTVIHCEHPSHPSYQTAGGQAQQIRQAVEKGLIAAIGDKPEPDRRVFAPGRLRDVLKEIPSTGLRILALNDMSVPEPATRAGAIEVFRRDDRDIEDGVAARPNLVRIAVLVRTADKFNGELEFNFKARLRNWFLLRIPVAPDGTYTWDPDNVRFIHQQVAWMRNGDPERQAVT